MADLLANDLYVADPEAAPLLVLDSASIVKAAPLGRLSLRARADALGDAANGFGTPLPTRPLSAELAPKRAALWMGPDEWTLLCPDADTDEVFAAVEASLAEHPHSLVNITDRSEALIVSGPQATWLLNSGIFIDLTAEAFPVGKITRTIFHKSPVMLWRTGPDTFILEAWVSFAGYAGGLLVEAARDLDTAA